jgi:hypothetical protein
MVFHAADGEDLHFILSGDAAQIWPEAFRQLRSDCLPSFLGAEDAMEEAARV